MRLKYHNKPTVYNGVWYHSKKEAKYAAELDLAKKAGDLKFFLSQVAFHLPGGIKYLCDFVEFWKNGEVRFVDVKGFKTSTYRLKKKLVESIYPIEIIEC